jgi:hypothetical protein
MKTVGDLIGFLWDSEWQPTYCSPPWGRTGARDVREILKLWRPKTLEEALAAMRSGELPQAHVGRWDQSEQTRYTWKRAAPAIAEHIDKERERELFTSVPPDQADKLPRPSASEIQAAINKGREDRDRAEATMRPVLQRRTLEGTVRSLLENDTVKAAALRDPTASMVYLTLRHALEPRVIKDVRIEHYSVDRICQCSVQAQAEGHAESCPFAIPRI